MTNADDFPTTASASFPQVIPQPGEIWKMLNGQGVDRGVMIVQEPPQAGDHEEVTVMVLSTEVQAESEVDVRLPSQLSGLAADWLAETWHVLTVLRGQLSEPIGRRLPRSVYDALLDIGDRSVIKPSEAALAEVGLTIADLPIGEQFHQQEWEWSEALRHQAQAKAMAATEQVLQQVAQLEQDLEQDLEPIGDAAYVESEI